ncbi:uncharacterized protein JCM6883_003846 [Sporobolomyces salmoneus]|uniref:uncharacterized protein n=1 Tax=Sporobolomyces salmoneus TaxID=183962 RepID=UPI0031745884
MSSYLNKQAPPPPPPRVAPSSSTPSSSDSPSTTRTKPSHRHKQSIHYNDAPDLASLTADSEGGGVGVSRSRSKTANRASRVPALGSIPSASQATSTLNAPSTLKDDSLTLPAFNAPPPPPPLPISSIRTGPRSLPYDITQFPTPSLTTKLVLVFIPGNPGLVSYYDSFLSTLQSSLPLEVKETTEIYAVGHLGHSLNAEREGMVKGFKPSQQATLEEQVESKVEFVDELKVKYGDEVKIMVLGHSIGSWICLQMLKQRPNLISSAHLLFPTISSMSLTPNGRKLSPLFSSWSLRPLFYSTSFFSYLPTSIISTLVSLLTGQSGPGSSTTTSLVSSPQTVIAAITMASKEMSTVTSLDRELLRVVGEKCWWYWAEEGKDGWVLEESIREIEETLGNEPEMLRKRERCREGMPHAFVLNQDHSTSLAKKCADWIVKDLESTKNFFSVHTTSTLGLFVFSAKMVEDTPLSTYVYLFLTQVYTLSRSLIQFITLRIPYYTFATLSWATTLTFRLTTFKIAIFLFVLSSAASWAWKVKYLNRYTELRELPGGKIGVSEGFDLHPDLAHDQHGKDGFHNYLDEFLSAIKVFGYLEKPVFHELARHLQTRRLVAGDTLDLSQDKSFYIVVDGRVEVYAQNPTSSTTKTSNNPSGATNSRRSKDPLPSGSSFNLHMNGLGRREGGREDSGEEDQDSDDDDEGEGLEGSGWQLLNCVESGGTLSSLFTILSLFTEDVKLRYEEDHHGTGSEEREGEGERNGDVADFDLNDSDRGLLSPGGLKRPGLSAIGRSMTSDTDDADDERGEIGSGGKGWKRKSSFMKFSTSSLKGGGGGSNTEAEDSTIAEEPEEEQEQEDDDDEGKTKTAKATPSFTKTFSTTPPTTAYPFPPMNRQNSSASNFARPPPFSHPSSRPKRKRSAPAPHATSSKQFETTLARATVDTTLAVIPAEAFRRLTKKFPNAAAHIVQVILTRLQRVTLLTAHKYLGLTREVIRTEEAINDLACYPLPNTFWEDGGIQRLRARFVPETKMGDEEEDERGDYFGRATAGGGGGGNARRATVGGKGGVLGSGNGNGIGGRRKDRGMPLETPYAGPRMGEVFWSDELDSSEHEGIRLKLRTPSTRRKGTSTTGGGGAGTKSAITRKTGDLLTMSSVKSGSTTIGSPAIQAPRLDRMTSTRSLGGGAGGEEEFDLRGAVMECISKAIGLVQPHVTPSTSVQASPSVGPHEYPNTPSPGMGSRLRSQAAFNSSFSSLSLLGLQGLHDDESSVSSLSASGMFAGELGTGSRNFASMDLENEVEILYFPKDSMLVKEGERNAGLYFVIEGFLDVSMPDEGPIGGTGIGKKPTREEEYDSPSSKKPHSKNSSSSFNPQSSAFRDAKNKSVPFSATKGPKVRTSTPPAQKKPTKKSIPLFTVRPGGIAGYLSSLTGFPSYVDIIAKTECYVGFLPAKALERIMDRKPIVLLTLAKRLISLLSPLVLHIDSALDWMHVSAGQVIYRPGDEADSFYIVINGRLRSITERQGGGVEVQAEYGQGDSVGELDCITASPRPSTLHAIRDTELARMPMTLFNAISVHHPLVTVQISRIIASRLKNQLMSQNSLGASIPKQMGKAGSSEGLMGKNNFNLKTVAIIPTNRHVPVSEFATKLHQALESIGATTSYLNQATVMQVLGRHAFSKMGQLKLAGWLAENEQKYRIVLYVADTAVSAPWTQTCIRQADCIFVVADAGAEPSLGEHEKLLVGMKTTARKELVLLHAERFVQPGTTRLWLRNRPWIHAHHHVEMVGATPESHRDVSDPAAVVALRKIAARVEYQISKYKKTNPRPIPQRTPALSDFARLARRLCGRSIGVVLGGGGARGISHIGVLRALSERNIPVDMIGGTSIGAFIGGLYAKEGDLVSTFGRAKRFSGRMSTLWRILTDLTYPVVAYTTGHEFNRGIYKSFYDTNIEDMWLPYFCNTTNITHSRMDVHTSGYAWRYVRASMSLAGLLPPLCDEGDMLVDGGYVDNLPVSVMLAQGASSVFAVDVGSVDDTDPRNYGESVSGWWLLIQRWNPFGNAPNIPSITEIQARLTYVSSVKTLEEAKNTPGVLYMRMPVTQFGTMEFKRFTEILQVGSDFSKGLLTEWDSKGELPTGLEGDVTNQKAQKRGQSIRRNSI